MGAPLSVLPRWAVTCFRELRNSLRALPHYGQGRLCPVCGRSFRRFLSSAVVPREDARCPRCGSFERHRFLWVFLAKRTNLFDGRSKKILHIAPEPCLESRLRKVAGEGYLSADLYNPLAMARMDITRIDFPDNHFNVIFCSHVLEHVPEDRKAMKEFHRVLQRGGWAVLNVPIGREETFEDPSIIDPRERLAAFGQDDHVRIYGKDYLDRLAEAGFEVEVVEVGDIVDAGEAKRMGLTEASGEIFFCKKH